ncbi:LOW QUALITY PROTEIN: PDZ domain-containing protein 8 [Phascolarctos cinereus]|uniref:LOW QUALITY PROTEIN: PDZ domain-containing protein 8 n=1 Tax=Phascolarctos cinereus TaxID=38626 RepID=A0A6P5KE64_PHACI|nr:LOW QUALITY PROTEIN: PDZ domain-containing protein 8 [Phascolarctos cinereus]
MELLMIIAVSALVGSFLTLLAQFLLLYQRSPEPLYRPSTADWGVHHVTPVPGLHLREYLYGGSSGRSSKPPEGGGGGGSGGGGPNSEVPRSLETCYFLNAILLFLFRELRDTAVARHWITKKIRVEFEELLQSKTAGRLLEGLGLREVSLGRSVPYVKTIRLLQPVVPSFSNEAVVTDGAEDLPAACPEELIFELDVEYSGGFHLAIDVDLVFGKSAYLFVKLSHMTGKLRLVFTRLPFTHWAFSFVEEPVMDLEVRSHFEGRPMPQLTSIIVNQLKKVLKRKHTLPNYKIRFKPFFPFQVSQTTKEENEALYIQQSGLAEGRLKITLIECSRLLILGSYEREANIHCTLELSSGVWEEKQRSSIKTAELVKGNLQSVGLTLRLVQSSDGYGGHVVIETVAPNSPASLADLQRGDRLIAIGGVKITSTIQVLKLIKQAGDRVMVYYERPVGQSNQGSVVQDSFTPVEDNSLLANSYQPNFEEDIASLVEDIDNKDIDLEFEDLACDVKVQNESKDEIPSVSQSPKRSSAQVNKSYGSVSPILSRKPSSYVVPRSSQVKDAPKLVTHRVSETLDPAQQSARASQTSLLKPSVSPRPQMKSVPPSTQSQTELDILVEKTEKPPSLPQTEKLPEKLVTNINHTEDASMSKPSVVKQEVVKDPVSDSANKDSADDQTWESAEILYHHKVGKWTRKKGTCIFDIEDCHKYLNVALWCRDPFKVGGLICLGHVSVKLEEIALGCLATSNLDYFTKFRLNPPKPKAMVTRTALRNLNMQKGFNETFCFGDITMHFKYLKEGEYEQYVNLMEKEKESNLIEDVPALIKDEYFLGQMNFAENKHCFQDTQFQNPTWCDYCKKKVWTKAASQCIFCAYVCHKKCQEKCFSETPLCVGPEKQMDRILKNLRIEGQENIIGMSSNKSVGKSTGITRHLWNTSSRILSLRQSVRRNQGEQIAELVEPSPKLTPNTSDNEGSDTEGFGPNSPSKRVGSSGIKLARKEGGLDDSVFIAVKEIGRDLYRGLPNEERFQKLEFMLDKLQNEIDQELEHNNSIAREEKEATDSKKKALLSTALTKSGERLQALTLLMIHYRAGIEDLELETLSLYQTKKVATDDAEEDLDNEICELMEAQPFDSISDELFDSSEPL